MTRTRRGPLGRGFFQGPTVEVARRLLGVRLVHETRLGRTVGRIVETEAYLAQGDAASHSACGPTARNGSMFLAPGHAYVYLIYGVHLCFNVVTSAAGTGEAVLIRALEPIEGLECMSRRRGVARPRDLCSGPGKLTEAMGIRAQDDGRDLTRGGLCLLPGEPVPEERVRTGPRVGISRALDRELRFWVGQSRWVSRAELRTRTGLD